jgi:NitT/TauT family transport system permease protein
MRDFFNRWLTRGARSKGHAAYLKHVRTWEWTITLCRLLILIACIAGWEWGARSGWLDPFLFSSPGRIVDTFVQMTLEGRLLADIGFTVSETVLGFILGTGAGTALATFIWYFPFLSRVLDPYLVVLNSMPKVALGPLFIVTIGAGFGSILAMAIAITIIITTLVMISSFQSVRPEYIQLARSFGATRSQIFRTIIFPASIPDLIATLKVNVGLAWVGVIVGEFLVSKAGLGHLIIYGFQVFNLTLVMMSLVIIAGIATLMYEAVSRIEKRLLRHRPTDGR